MAGLTAGAAAGGGPGTVTIAERKAAMETILRAMYTDAPESDTRTGAASTSARPINPPTSLPIIGRAWTEQIHVHTISVAGISILRNSVRKELDFLNRTEAKQTELQGHRGGRDGSPDVTISSNAPFLEAFWSCLQHYVRIAPPLTDLSTSVPAPMVAGNVTKQITAAPLKVDVVANGGQLWVRLFTLKPSSLLQEFRLVEAEEAEDSSDEEDEVGPSASTMKVGGHFAFDEAARRSSIYRTAQDLRQAADHAQQLHGSQSASAPRIKVHLILTRLDRSDALPQIPGSTIMRDFPEDARYKLRLNAILDELERIPDLQVFTSGSVPFSKDSNHVALPLPTFVPRDILSDGASLRHINLDLSALVALTSDIVHGAPIAADATLEHARARFHTTAPYKLPSPNDASSSKPNIQTGAHGRALAEQLWRECCHSVQDGGDFLHSLIQTGASSNHASAPQIVFSTTRESAEKFVEIVDLVAGEEEKRRAWALLGQSPGGASNLQAFWAGSRWEGHQTIRDRLQLPVRVFEDHDVPKLLWTDPLAREFAEDLEAIVSRSLLAQDEALGPGSALATGTGSATASAEDASGTASSGQGGGGSAPTPHTLRSLLAGSKHGMTTLTTNFTSIKWLARHSAAIPQGSNSSGMARQPITSSVHNLSTYPVAPGSLGLIGKYYLDEERLEGIQSPQSAVVWVMHPRSFVEQMRVRSDLGQAAREVPSSTQGSRETRSEGATNLALGPERAAAAALPSAVFAGRHGTDVIVPIHDDQGPAHSPMTSPPDAPKTPSRRKGRGVGVPSLRTIGLWIRGPSAPEPLVIRHYPWWPLGGVERRWVQLTALVAWEDPHGRADNFVGPDASAEESASSPSRFAHLRERGRAKARAGIRNVREGLPTWVRSPSVHRESQIELSPGSARRRLVPQSDKVDGEAWLSTGGGAAADPSLLQQARERDGLRPPVLLRSATSPQLNGKGSSSSADSDEILETGPLARELHPTYTGRNRSLAHRGNVHQPQEGDDDALTRDDFLESVWADWRINRLHWILLFVTCACWIIGFAVLAKSLWYESSVFSSQGTSDSNDDAQLTPAFYGCTSTYWLGNADCGLNGQDCAPFESETPAAFRCPSGCLGTQLGSPRAVGDLRSAWVPLVVGGGDAEGTYRGDSWVCAAAAHAGIIDARRGGCGSLTLTGTFSGFVGDRRNGVDSIDFNSTFPVSYRFGAGDVAGKCTDRRGQLYILDVIMSAWVGFVLRPKPIVWFWILVCVGYWHVNFASEPRDFPPPVGSAFSDFLPTLFGCYAIWRVAFRYVWPHFRGMPLEREVWTLAAFWIGVLLNVVFAGVPLSRLVGRDLATQPGAITALIILILVVLVLALNQVRVIRKTTYLPRYLSIYATGGVVVGLLAAIPTQSLRIHHYIISLILLPGSAFPTRLSLIYCAFLLGMFLNGLGRWGWDGLLQDTAVVIGDGTRGTGLPQFLNSSTNWAGVNSSSPLADGMLSWAAINSSDPDQEGFDSFNLLVDDVLRYSGSGTTFNLSSIIQSFTDVAGGSDEQAGSSNQTAGMQDAAIGEAIRTEPHYLRLAFASGAGPGDFTRAAIAYFNGTFVDAPEGAT